MIVLVTCKNGEDPSKNEHTGVLTTFPPLISLWDFFRRSWIANYEDPGLILLNFKPIQDFTAVLDTSNNGDHPIKN